MSCVLIRNFWQHVGFGEKLKMTCGFLVGTYRLANLGDLGSYARFNADIVSHLVEPKCRLMTMGFLFINPFLCSAVASFSLRPPAYASDHCSLPRGQMSSSSSSSSSSLSQSVPEVNESGSESSRIEVVPLQLACPRRIRMPLRPFK